MKKPIWKTLLGGILFVLLSACKHEPLETAPPRNAGTGNGGNGTGSGTGTTGTNTNPCDPSKIYFQQQVLPILNANCNMSGCHNEASYQDDVILTSYQNVINTAGVRSGNARESKIYKMITEKDPRKRMPRNRDPLTDAQIKIIYDWIQQGAKNESCTATTCDAATVSFSGIVKNIIATNCQGCHSGSAPAAGINFSTYAGIKAKADDGRLWGAINHLPGFSKMPKSSPQLKLSDCEIKQIDTWIKAGAPNN